MQSCDLRFVSVRQWRDLCTGREMNKRAIVPVAPAGITLELLKHSWMKLTWYCTHSDWVLFFIFLAGGGVVGESATGYSFMHSAILFHLNLIYPRFWRGGGHQISFVELKSRSQRRFARTGVKGTANHLCFAYLFNGYRKYYWYGWPPNTKKTTWPEVLQVA